MLNSLMKFYIHGDIIGFVHAKLGILSMIFVIKTKVLPIFHAAQARGTNA